MRGRKFPFLIMLRRMSMLFIRIKILACLLLKVLAFFAVF